MQPNAYPPRQYSCLACGAARSSRVCGTCLKNGQSLTGLLGFWQERERLRRKLLDARRLDHIIKAQEERQARKRRLRHRRETLEHELQTARDHVKRRRDAAGKNLALAGREVSRLLRWGADHQRYHTLDAKRHTCCFAVASTEQLRVAALLLRDVCIIFRPTVAARKDWAMPAVTSVQGWRIPALDGLQAVSDAHGLSAALGFVGHLLQALQLILGPPCTSCVLYRGCQSSIVRTAQFADLFCLPFASDSRGHAAQQWANFENQPGDGLGAPATSEVMQAGRPRNMPLYISGAENISETLSGANPSRDEWRHHELRAALGCLHRAVLVTSASQAHLCGTLYLPPTRPPTEILLRLLHKLCMNGRSTSCDAYAAGTRSNVHPVAPAGPPKNALPGSPSSPVLHVSLVGLRIPDAERFSSRTTRRPFHAHVLAASAITPLRDGILYRSKRLGARAPVRNSVLGPQTSSRRSRCVGDEQSGLSQVSGRRQFGPCHGVSVARSRGMGRRCRIRRRRAGSEACPAAAADAGG
ncbi:unnamed protein product [Pedinophyceae sp. YPF-701]|nr:unnamed protein product [Pedinophyceae sp. YPF-701]